jgi:16S rRNA (uracil1498-N3)-methyltransferase
MTLRLYLGAHLGLPLAAGAELSLPPGPARHAQVRRLQPGDALQLFDGRGGEWAALVVGMGRQEVRVRVGEPLAPQPEGPVQVALAFGMPTNERMDALIEKATELGVATLHPLMCDRSVLRLHGERAERKRVHWQAIAVAACEQCGRTGSTTGTVARLLLSLARGAPALRSLALDERAVVALSGPEGGLTPAEEQAALTAGFAPVGLGPRVLRADTAPLALLAWIGLRG